MTRIGLLLPPPPPPGLLAGLSLTGELWSLTTLVRGRGDPVPTAGLNLLSKLILVGGFEESDSASLPASVRVRLWAGRVEGSSGSWKYSGVTLGTSQTWTLVTHHGDPVRGQQLHGLVLSRLHL